MMKGFLSNKISRLIGLLSMVVFILALFAPFSFFKVTKPKIEKPKVVVKPIEKPQVIEKPLHDVDLPDFANIVDVKEKKRQFFDFIRPSVVQENQALLDIRKQLSHWLEKVSLEEPLTDNEQQFLASLSKTYKINKDASLLQQLDELLVRVDVVPSALILVQAANESAWGTSRFARIGLNFFGIWCYRPTCGMVPSGRNDGAKHEVAAFKSVDAAVRRYLYNINTHNAYIVFRSIRSQLRAQDQILQPEVLATGLLPYSERGTDYVLEITEMIRHNRDFLYPQSTDVVTSD